MSTMSTMSLCLSAFDKFGEEGLRIIMSEHRSKYESQLPKRESWSLDRIFSYLGTLATVIALIASPLIIEDPSHVSYIYLIFLSILVIVLIAHAVMVEKRKLHRYAQTVLHTHFAQHVVRDSISGLVNSNRVNLEMTTEKVLDAIANSFSITSGKTCRASIIDIDDEFELSVVARDTLSSIGAVPRTKKHTLEENTDFRNLWYSINGCSRYYLNNNIVKSWIEQNYRNSCFAEHKDPEIKSVLGITFVKGWPLKYKSALVLPIRYISEFVPPKEENKKEAHWKYFGFLCIDSISKNSFDERYAPELGAIFADMLYTYFSTTDFLLDKLGIPKTEK